MFGVDKGDQFRAHFGGFANRAHFKKWYVKVYLAILDCALLNAYSAWNLSCRTIPGRKKLTRYKFMWALSEEMLKFKDEEEASTAMYQLCLIAGILGKFDAAFVRN